MSMPVVFIGHGSPMNAIEENDFTRAWQQIAGRIGKPAAILCISAHWYTDGLRVSDDPNPRMIYDMVGFPKELYDLQYPAPGAPDVARGAAALLSPTVRVDNNWGIDHGAWSVLCRMYPEADIPVCQLSVDRSADAQRQFDVGRQLRSLREEGVLILGSGNVVHNLARIRFDEPGGFAWAQEFDDYVHDSILRRDFDAVVDHRRAGSSAALAFPTPDHYYPLLSILGAANEDDEIAVYSRQCFAGSLSMTSYVFGS